MCTGSLHFHITRQLEEVHFTGEQRSSGTRSQGTVKVSNLYGSGSELVDASSGTKLPIAAYTFQLNKTVQFTRSTVSRENPFVAVARRKR